jgi:hypothetical protein
VGPQPRSQVAGSPVDADDSLPLVVDGDSEVEADVAVESDVGPADVVDNEAEPDGDGLPVESSSPSELVSTAGPQPATRASTAPDARIHFTEV